MPPSSNVTGGVECETDPKSFLKRVLHSVYIHIPKPVRDLTFENTLNFAPSKPSNGLSPNLTTAINNILSLGSVQKSCVSSGLPIGPPEEIWTEFNAISPSCASSAQSGLGRLHSGIDPSGQEEYGPPDESRFHRSYALSTAHEEVVAAFSAGQRRLQQRMTHQQRRDSMAQADAERMSHMQILEEHFGRNFLKKALKLVEEPDPPPVQRTSLQQVDSEAKVEARSPVPMRKKSGRGSSSSQSVVLHARAWFSSTHSERSNEDSDATWSISTAAAVPATAAMPAALCEASTVAPPPLAPSFRLRPRTTTEDLEIEL